jgi:hypothetical protein
MSKRLRSPLRTTLRGRSLRPRASQPRLDATETGAELRDSTPDYDEAAELSGALTDERISSEPSLEELATAAPIPVEQTPLPAPVTVATFADAPMPMAVEATATPTVSVAAPAPEPANDAPALDAEPASLADHAAPPSSSIRERETVPEHPYADEERAEAKPDTQCAKPSAREPAANTSVEDELSTSLSLSAEFFRKDEDSVPPFLPEDELEDPIRVEPPSPATLRRRRAFRGVVGTVIAVVGLCAVAVVGKTIASRSASASMPEVAPVAPLKQTPSSRLTAALGGNTPPPASPAANSEQAAAAPAAEPASTEAPKAEAAPEPAKAEEPAKPAIDEAPKPTGDGKELRKEALALLNRGKLKDAIPVARAAIAADPADALGYLYLGTALQDTGKWKDGIEAYSECVRNATKGPVNECRAMGGRK